MKGGPAGMSEATISTDGKACGAELAQWLAGGLAHDIRNVVAAILGNAEVLLSRLGEGSPGRAEAQDIRSAAERATRLARWLQALQNRYPPAPAEVNLNAVVEELLPALEDRLGENVQVVARLSEETLPVFSPPDRLEEVVLCLLVNVIDMTPGVRTLTVLTEDAGELSAGRAGEAGVAPGAYVLLTVTGGHGTGIDAADRVTRIVAEDAAGYEARERTPDLGFATTLDAVHRNGGAVRVRYGSSQSVAITVLWPRAQGATGPPV